MNQCLAIILLIIIVIVVYFLVKTNQKSIRTDFFTLLRSIEKPLTSYDDYGTFNFIHHTNDLPYYDPIYDDMFYLTKTNYKPETKLPLSDSIISSDSFINVRGDLVRRKLIPFNYTDYGGTPNNNKRIAPQGVNYYWE